MLATVTLLAATALILAKKYSRADQRESWKAFLTDPVVMAVWAVVVAAYVGLSLPTGNALSALGPGICFGGVLAVGAHWLRTRRETVE